MAYTVIEVAVYFSRSHFMVRMSPQLVRHCAWAIRHETLIKFIIIILIIIIIIIIIIMQFYFAHFGDRARGWYDFDGEIILKKCSVLRFY